MSENDEGQETPMVTVTTDEAGEQVTDLDIVRDALLDSTLEYEVDPEKMARAIVERILREPAASVFKPDDIRHARDLIGQPFRIRGVSWYPSAFEEGPAIYAACDAVVLATGELCVVTVGSTRGLAQLYRAVKDGMFPIDVRVVEALRPTSRGFYPYHLEALEPEPAEKE